MCAVSCTCLQVLITSGQGAVASVWVAKTGALFKFGNPDFMLADYWDAFPNQLSSFAMLKNTPAVLQEEQCPPKAGTYAAYPR